MATGIELGLLALVVVLLVGAYVVVKAVKPLIVNAVVGLIVLFLVEAIFGFEVALTPIAIIVVALGGIPGAVLVLLLAWAGVAFVPFVLLPLG